MNGIAQITIDGQPVVLKFGMPAIRRIAEKMIEFNILAKDLYGDLGLAHILYAGYENGCFMDEKPTSLKLRQFYNYVEEGGIHQEEVEAAIKAFVDSKYMKAEIEKKKAEMMTTDRSTGMI